MKYRRVKRGKVKSIETLQISIKTIARQKKLEKYPKNVDSTLKVPADLVISVDLNTECYAIPGGKREAAQAVDANWPISTNVSLQETAEGRIADTYT